MKSQAMTYRSLALEVTAGQPAVGFPHTIAPVITKGEWKPFNYLKLISKVTVDQIIKGDGRLILNLPPRHGKTQFLIYLIIWFLTLYPKKSVIFSSHTQSFSEQQVRLVRNIIKSANGFLPLKLSNDSNSAERFHLVQGGGCLSSAVSSALIGQSGHLIILDDLHRSFEEAQTERSRNQIIKWFTGTLYSRLEPGGTIICSSARWNSQDLCAYLLKSSEPWTHLSFSALSLGNKVDPLSRDAGQPLSPDLFNVDALKRIEQAVGPQVFAAQYQQVPHNNQGIGGSRVFPEELLGKIQDSDSMAFDHRNKNSIYDRSHIVGIDPGGHSSHFACVICETRESKQKAISEIHVIKIIRYPLKIDILEILKEIVLLSNDSRFGRQAPNFVIDSSGAGGKIFYQLLRNKNILPIVPVTIISRGKSRREKVHKEDLVTNLITTIESQQLMVPNDMPDRELLFDEFEYFNSSPSPKNYTTQYKPVNGRTDDLIMALSLVAYACGKGWVEKWTREPVGISRGTMKRRPISARSPLY